MNLPAPLEERINALLVASPYGLDPQAHEAGLLELLKDEIAFAGELSAPFRNYTKHWPVPYREAVQVADLPYLPVGFFKADPPFALVQPNEIVRTLASSATTGQVPSRVVLDAATSRRMTKGIISIIRNFIGSTRRPYLVIDTPKVLGSQGDLGARGAAIQGLRSFATEIICCLQEEADGLLELDESKLMECAHKWKDVEILMYGFTYILWNHLVKPLAAKGITLNLPNVRVFHSGGWKRLQQMAVTKDAFTRGVASILGCPPGHVVDFYGMVENVGVVYPDCEYGNKHVPAFAGVIIRDPLTLKPVAPGRRGLAQVCSVLPSSFPGFLALTDDIAELVSHDGCPCGRRGTSFRFIGRAPKTEIRGCGNVNVNRERASSPIPAHA